MLDQKLILIGMLFKQEPGLPLSNVIQGLLSSFALSEKHSSRSYQRTGFKSRALFNGLFALLLLILCVFQSVLAGSPRIAVDLDGESVFAVSETGEVWSWGSNSFGQLGQGTLPAATAKPTRVIKGNNQPLDEISEIAAGENFAVALTKDGKVWSWGDNSLGQLGSGTTGGTRNKAALVFTKSGSGLLSSLSNIKAVSAGRNTGYAINQSGKIYAWGEQGAAALLGDGGGWAGSVRNFADFVLMNLGVNDVDATHAYSIAGGSGDFVLAGANPPNGGGTIVLGWGNSVDNHLGRYKPNPTTLGLRLTTGVSPFLFTKHCIQVDLSSSAGFCVTPQGELWEWGGGAHPDTPDMRLRNTTATANDVLTVNQLAAGFRHVLALRTDGSIWAWGDDDKGALGFSAVPPSGFVRLTLLIQR